MAAYLGDNDDDMFPMPGAGDVESWPVVLGKKYVTNWKTFRSPFDKETPSRPTRTEPPNVPVSYGINQDCFGKNTSKFAAPSQLFLAAPAYQPAMKGEPVFTFTSETNPVLIPPNSANNKGGTHSGGTQINVLYADTHVASVNYRQFSEIQTPAGIKQWRHDAKDPQ
jgi:prepilin-type processing-associated H-X9-DG protein